MEASLHYARFNNWKLKTSVNTKFCNKAILFQEIVEYQDAIDLCYGMQKTLEL
jgi:hypothetical protein